MTRRSENDGKVDVTKEEKKDDDEIGVDVQNNDENEGHHHHQHQEQQQDEIDATAVAAGAGTATDAISSSPTSITKMERARQIYRGEALSPMVRAGTLPLRALALQYGADWCYTEELVDKSLIDSTRIERDIPNNYSSNNNNNNKFRVVDFVKDNCRGGSKKETSVIPLLLRIDPVLEGSNSNNSSKLVCQLGTGDADLALQAALKVHKDVAAIDINMGCPKRFSTAGGMGSALLQDPQRACDIIRKLSTHLPAPIPVSAKIRLLSSTSPQPTVDFCVALVNAGVHAIAIHGRRVGDTEVQPADWDTLRQVTTILTDKFQGTIPICVNGDFYTRQEFTQFMQETKASGVLLGRPALVNTSIFRKPSSSNYDDGSLLYGYDSPLLVDKMTVIQDYIRYSVQYQAHWKNTKYVICEMLNYRRTPTARVPLLVQAPATSQRPRGGASGRRKGEPSSILPTIAQTCACKSMEAICQVWNVNMMMNHDTQQPQQQQVDEPQPAGEHKYHDSYFLNDSGNNSAAATSTTGTSPNNKKDDDDDDKEEKESLTNKMKRPRIDEPSSSSSSV